MSSAELFRQNADDCRQRSMEARTTVGKANWLKIPEEWRRLAEDAANVPSDVPRAKGK